MKFIVTRTSGYKDKPCEEAKLDTITRVESYTFHSPEEFDKRYAHLNRKKWLLEGTNHRINKEGHITRDNGVIKLWIVEINTLEELMQFYDKYGAIIICDNFYNDSIPMLEIYDDYRE